MRSAGLEDFVSFLKGLPWKLMDRTNDPFLRARLTATFDALIQIGAIEWRPRSELPIGEYDRVPLREDELSRFSALLPKHAPGLADSFYVLREREGGVSHVAGPYPISKLDPTPEPRTPFPAHVAVGLAFTSHDQLTSAPSCLGIFAGKTGPSSFGSILGMTSHSTGAPLAFA